MSYQKQQFVFQSLKDPSSVISENGQTPVPNLYYRAAQVNILPPVGPIFIRTGDIQKTKDDFDPVLQSRAVNFFVTAAPMTNQSRPAISKTIETDRM